MRVRAGQPAASGPDPVHHEGGAVLEDAEVFFLHALRGVQEQVEVQVTGSLDLDFPAHALWEKHGGGSFLLLTCSLAKRLGRPCCQLSPAEAEPEPPAAACRPPPALTLLLLGGIGGSKQVGQRGAQRRGHVLRKVVRVGFCGKSHRGQRGGRCPRVSGGAGQLLTAADGLGPAPGPTALALPLCRPCQHQIRGAAVADLVPKAKSGPRPHRAHGDAWAGAVAGCEGAEGDGVSRDPPARPGPAHCPLPPARPAPWSPVGVGGASLGPMSPVGVGGAFRRPDVRAQRLRPPQNRAAPAEKPLSGRPLPKPREPALARWAIPSVRRVWPPPAASPMSVTPLPLPPGRSLAPRPHAPRTRARSEARNAHGAPLRPPPGSARGPAPGAGTAWHRRRRDPQPRRAACGARLAPRHGAG